MGCSVRVCVVRGPLAPWAAGFESWLAARGYSPSTIYNRLRQLASLSRWLDGEGLGVAELTAERAERFLDARRSAGRSTWVSPRCLALPLEYLREVGAVPESVPAIAGDAVDELLERYREYLLLERGLAGRTIVEYQRTARLFLEQRPVGLELERLTAADVSGFLVRECPRRTVAGARHLVSDLRPLLRYLHVAGLIETQLVWAVPGVADLRDRSLPRGLEAKVVARLLASCDRRRTVGRRDYAIVLLLVRLGLRAAEVAAIQLEDVDWRRGEILVRGKRNRHDVLALPVDVGEALVSYLQRRGPDQSRAVFLRVTAPVGPLTNDAVRGVVHDACVRAGVPPVGAHRLRHTAATGMLREGASLPEIAQVLRHREIKTTSIYAKVDRARLRALAKPWPGAVMTDLRSAVNDYLAVRRQLGFQLREPERLLDDYLSFCEHAGEQHLTTELAVRWARSVKAHPNRWQRRLGVIRGFARYLSTIDPETEIPSEDLLRAALPRVAPYLYSPTEITALMSAARELTPPLRAATFETIIGLLAVSGLRAGEALGLDRADVDLHDGALHVRAGKDKQREVPLHDTTTRALVDYGRLRDRSVTELQSPAFFLSPAGARVNKSAFNATFATLIRQIGLEGCGQRARPRAHDLRHSFAVRTLIEWYRDGEDVDRQMPLLSTLLGHVDPASTYWYLQAAPELLALISERLEGLLEELS